VQKKRSGTKGSMLLLLLLNEYLYFAKASSTISMITDIYAGLNVKGLGG